MKAIKLKLAQVSLGKRGLTPTNSEHAIDVCKNVTGNNKQIQRHDDIELRPDDNNMNACQLLQLPTEIVTSIISHFSEQPPSLYQCTLVNKLFHAITNPLLWQLLFFSDGAYDSTVMKLFGIPFMIKTDQFLAGLSDASPERRSTLFGYIRDLRLDSMDWTDEQWTHVLLPHIPYLNHVTITNSSRITDTSVQHLHHYCQHLTSLKLVYANVSKNSFSVIGQHCHQLAHLKWILAKHHSVEWLELLVPCPLETLEIRCRTSLDDEKTASTFRKFNHLTSLCISTLPIGCQKLFLPPPPTDDNNSIQWWPHLTELYVDPCHTIDDTIWIEFIKSHSCLQRLELRNVTEWTDSSLDAMIRWLPHLTRLVLNHNSHMTSGGIQRLIDGCRDLAYIDLRYCERVSKKELLGLDSERKYNGPLGNNWIKLDQTKIAKIRQNGC